MFDIVITRQPGRPCVSLATERVCRTTEEGGRQMETFEFLPKFGKSSFLQKQESSHLNGFIDSRFRGNDKEGRFSKVSNEAQGVG